MYFIILFVGCLLYIVATTLLLIWANRKDKAIQEEYGECFALEKERRKEIPRRFRRLSRHTMLKLIPVMCGLLCVPNIKEVKSGPFVCRFCAVGMYCWLTQTIYIKGWLLFSAITFIHEIAHHVDLYRYSTCECISFHGPFFISAERDVFDAFLKATELI